MKERSRVGDELRKSIKSCALAADEESCLDAIFAGLVVMQRFV
jgi:hypothetical protein